MLDSDSHVMLRSITKVFLVVLFAPYLLCERRIIGGERTNRGYMVYLVWDITNKKLTEFRDTNTICGGVLVSEDHVLTSAVCLHIYEFQYVIGGYNRYIQHGIGRNDEENKCLEIAKKPIVAKFYTEATDDYLQRENIYETDWHSNDFALAKFETPYDFNDKSFLAKCSYQPYAARIYYGYVDVGRDVVVLGWGSNKYQTAVNYTYDLNQDYLMATGTVIINNTICMEKYTKYRVSEAKYCSEGIGHLDVDGTPIESLRRINKNSTKKPEPLYILDQQELLNKKIPHKLQVFSRKNGPCQNDHGGPLVTWILGSEFVFALVSGYLVNENLECVGPYIYIRLIRAEPLIICTTSKDIGRRKEQFCKDQEPDDYVEIIEKQVHWTGIL